MTDDSAVASSEAVTASENKAYPDLGGAAESSGMYTLCGVVTHKGRDADSGHYVGWSYNTKKEVDEKDKDPKNWIKFDDEKVSEHSEEDVKLLVGGGDHHMAYIVMYRRVDDMTERKIRVEEEKKEANKENSPMTE